MNTSGFRSFARIAVVGAIALLATACASVNAMAGGDGPSTSPRSAVLDAADKVEPAIKEVTVLLTAGLISDNVADDVLQFGPVIQKIAAAYFSNAEACVVIGGQLVTDPAAGRPCQPGVLRQLYSEYDAELLAWLREATDAGDKQAVTVIMSARFVSSLVPPPVPGGPFPGYLDVEDYPLESFKLRRVEVAASFEAMLRAAEAHLARSKPKGS